MNLIRVLTFLTWIPSLHQHNQKMERDSNENDDDQIVKLMANYKTDKPIKVSYVFEDDDSDETGIVESNSHLPNNPAQCGEHSSQNKNNTNSATATATELLNTPLCDQNCYLSNVSFEDMEIGFNIEHERRKVAEENYNRSFQNQQTANFNAKTNSNKHLRQIENFLNQTFNHNHTNDWASCDKKQYIKLLDTVSDNVIMIAKCYHYLNVKNFDQNVRKYFQEQIIHYYYQSYNALVSAILPYEHNNEFIRNFINRTIEIANRKSSCHSINIRSLQPIILDMIRWAKYMKEYPDARINQLQNPMSRPLTTSLPPPYNAAIRQPINIQAPASLGPSIPTLPSYNDTRQRMCGPPVSQLSFVPAQLPFNTVCNSNTHHPMRRAPPISDAPPISVPPSQPPASNIFSSVNIRQQKSKLASVSFVPSDLPVPPPSASLLVPSILPEPHKTYGPTNYKDTRQPVPREKVPELSASSASNSITKSNANEQTLAKNDNSICLFSTGPPSSEISISIDAEIAKALNDTESSNKVRKSSYNRTSKRQKTKDIESPTLESTSSTWVPHTQIVSTENLIQEKNHSCYSPNQLQNTSNAKSVKTIVQPMINNPNLFFPGERQTHKDFENNEYHPSLLSRSESRDSGFGSPVLSALLTTDTVYPRCTDNQEFTPEIAHVTSMNPEAVFIASGTCKICGTTTRNKCIACYNVYYCGNKCQTLDWPLHMHQCKTR